MHPDLNLGTTQKEDTPHPHPPPRNPPPSPLVQVRVRQPYLKEEQYDAVDDGGGAEDRARRSRYGSGYPAWLKLRAELEPPVRSRMLGILPHMLIARFRRKTWP